MDEAKLIEDFIFRNIAQIKRKIAHDVANLNQIDKTLSCVYLSSLVSNIKVLYDTIKRDCDPVEIEQLEEAASKDAAELATSLLNITKEKKL